MNDLKDYYENVDRLLDDIYNASGKGYSLDKVITKAKKVNFDYYRAKRKQLTNKSITDILK